MAKQADSGEQQGWPLRIAILLVAGAACGAGFHFLTVGKEMWEWTSDPLRLGAAAFLVVGGFALAFTLDRKHWIWGAAFAIVAGLLAASVVYRNGGGSWGSGEGWQLFAALIAVALALPLFQAVRDAGGRRPDYASVHDHIWADIILWGGGWAFVIAVTVLAHLLGELFALIGLDGLRSLLLKRWFSDMLMGAAFGAAAGLLRDRAALLGLLRRTATVIVAVLAPILALGLALFVLALPFTGLHTLWDQTRATTPILLAAILSAFSLANVVLGAGTEEEPRVPVLRWAAMVLGAVMLPLGIVAAISTGRRIAQYGLTPDRLWACVFVGVAIGAGILYLLSLAHRRMRWAEDVREANLALAVSVAFIGLLLALPIVSFGAVSTHDQLVRLESGKVRPDAFDWSAMRWDFGPTGRGALERLRRSRNAGVADLALRALKSESRGAWMDQSIVEAAMSPRTILVRPAPADLPPALRDAVLEHHGKDDGVCTGRGMCTLFWKPGDTIAVAVMDHCAAKGPAPAPAVPERATVGSRSCSIESMVMQMTGQKWEAAGSGPTIDLPPGNYLPKEEKAQMIADRQAILRGEVEVREVRRRQLFLGGRPAGQVFE